jgi:hypothetical protein
VSNSFLLVWFFMGNISNLWTCGLSMIIINYFRNNFNLNTNF